MARKKKREDLGVYVFAGFLEAGKTTYIQNLLSGPGVPKDMRPLVLQTEEGMEEMEPIPGLNMAVRQITELEEITPERLNALEDETNCNTVLLELNGMWQEADLFARFPENWFPFRKFVVADAGTFLRYNANMRALAADKLKDSTVVIFNRCTPDTDRVSLHKVVRAASRQVPIFFQLPDGTEEPDDTPDELPYDLDADVVEIQDRDYAEWERDISEEPEKYDGKIIRLHGFVVKSRDKRPGRFGFGRQVMTCCEADITFLGFPAVCDPAGQPVSGSWVELTAKVELQRSGRDVLPVLLTLSCDKAEKPENTLATFY
jgi:hypothetical protein